MASNRPYNGEHAQYFEDSLKYMCFVDANASKEEQAKAIIDFNEEHFFGQSYIAYCENKGDGKPHVNAVHQVLDMRDPSKRPLPVYGVQIDVDFMDKAHSKMRGGLRGLTLDEYLDMVHHLPTGGQCDGAVPGGGGCGPAEYNRLLLYRSADGPQACTLQGAEASGGVESY